MCNTLILFLYCSCYAINLIWWPDRVVVLTTSFWWESFINMRLFSAILVNALLWGTFWSFYVLIWIKVQSWKDFLFLCCNFFFYICAFIRNGSICLKNTHLTSLPAAYTLCDVLFTKHKDIYITWFVGRLLKAERNSPRSLCSIFQVIRKFQKLGLSWYKRQQK